MKLSSTVKILPHYTYNEWVKWEGQWELIDGLPFAVTRFSEPNHQRISGNLVAEFGIMLENCSTCTAFMPIDYRVTDDTILQPDMLVVHNIDIEKEYLDFAPSLVAEILSPTTELKDRYTKFGIYESQGIQYYVIVSPDKEEAEVYELMDGKYHLKQSGKSFVHEFFFPECTARVDFKKIW